jgi:hypothetical protein
VGLLGNKQFGFHPYDGTTIDGVNRLAWRDMRNPGTLNAPSNYTKRCCGNRVETDSVILRTGVANTTIALTATGRLEAWKIENTVTTLNQGTFDLRIEGGGILAVSAAPVINSTTGRLYAGAISRYGGCRRIGGLVAEPRRSPINSHHFRNNPESGQTTALVQTGSGTTLSLSGLVNTYSGGTVCHGWPR